MANKKVSNITMSDYEYYRENYMGYCPECGDWTRDSTEPDAENYDCPECHQNVVTGAENALLEGLVEITEEE